jgi:hypothetical protein
LLLPEFNTNNTLKPIIIKLLLNKIKSSLNGKILTRIFFGFNEKNYEKDFWLKQCIVNGAIIDIENILYLKNLNDYIYDENKMY